MIIVPGSPAAIAGLNSYYLLLERLLEHYQGQLGGGALHLKAAAAECIVYFDETGPVGGAYQDAEGKMTGNGVLDHLLGVAERHNFTVAVYPMDGSQVHFWANVPHAEVIYRDLSAEFTDLEGLIKKMQTERLTGYIEVVLEAHPAPGRLFFSLGRFQGAHYPWKGQALDASRQGLVELIKAVRHSGGVFTVRRLSAGPPPPAPPPDPASDAAAVTTALQELLIIADNTVRSSRRIKGDFSTLLKKKFVQKADRYEFLDPFAAEFEYRDGRVDFHGDTPPERLDPGGGGLRPRVGRRPEARAGAAHQFGSLAHAPCRRPGPLSGGPLMRRSSLGGAAMLSKVLIVDDDQVWLRLIRKKFDQYADQFATLSGPSTGARR